jgi:hypothetical protein
MMATAPLEASTSNAAECVHIAPPRGKSGAFRPARVVDAAYKSGG